MGARMIRGYGSLSLIPNSRPRTRLSSRGLLVWGHKGFLGPQMASLEALLSLVGSSEELSEEGDDLVIMFGVCQSFVSR